MAYEFIERADHIRVIRSDGILVASFAFDEWGGRDRAWEMARTFEPDPEIAGRSLSEWKELARRDDCLDQMVPSDLRQILAAI